MLSVPTVAATCFDDQLLFTVEDRDPECAPLAHPFKTNM
jgi:hypothetical protein